MENKTFIEAALEIMRYRRMVFDEFGRVRWIWADTPIDVETTSIYRVGDIPYAPDLMRNRK